MASLPAADPRVDRSFAVLRTVLGDRLGRDAAVRAWDGSTIDAAHPAFTFVLCEPHALRGALTPPLDLNPGRAFAEGWFDVEGDLESAIDVLERGADRLGPLKLAALVAQLARLPKPPPAQGGAAHLQGHVHSRERDAAAVGFHYDQPVAFYRLFLGPELVYSCAYWDRGISDVDAAQAAKLDYVLDKVRLRPGQRFLDIGCGWGSLVIRAAQRGALAHGITLSRGQYAEARQRIAALGLGERATVELRDYRDLGDAQFDAVASVGMVEHVGRERQPEYFACAYRALRPGGLFLNHGIVVQSRDGKGWRAGGDFVGRYVFPDGDLAPIDTSIRAAEAAGFEVRDLENLREHYARTLRAWGQNLCAHRDEAVAMTDVRTERVWRLYMAGSARNFALGRMGLMQMIAAKPRPDGSADIPPTRRDLYERQR